MLNLPQAINIDKELIAGKHQVELLTWYAKVPRVVQVKYGFWGLWGQAKEAMVICFIQVYFINIDSSQPPIPG